MDDAVYGAGESLSQTFPTVSLMLISDMIILGSTRT